MQILYESLTSLEKNLEQGTFLKGKNAVMIKRGGLKPDLRAFQVAEGSSFEKNPGVLKKILTGNYICFILGSKKIKVYYGINHYLVSSVYEKPEGFSEEGFLEKILKDIFKEEYSKPPK